MSAGESATDLVRRLVDGDARVADELFPLVYDRLRTQADDLLRRERSDHTLQPTALVNEAYMKLADSSSLDWRGKAHFAAIAARAMREVLVDYARQKQAQKRGGDWERVTLQGVIGTDHRTDLDVLALDEALTKLCDVQPRGAHAIELSFFANMTATEIGSVLGVSERTVRKDLTIAQAWLLREMDRSGTG